MIRLHGPSAFGDAAPLGQLVPPDPAPPGAARIATAADRDRLAPWLGAFRQELDDLGGPGPGMVDALYQRLGYRPVEDRVVLEFQP